MKARMRLPNLAICGIYVGGAGQKMFNNATEVVLMRHGTTSVLSMEKIYQGPPSDFAMVVPVPVVVKESQVKTLEKGVFSKIDTLGAPRLVEYWEHDPCSPMYDEEDRKTELTAVEDSEEDDSAPREEKEYNV